MKIQYVAFDGIVFDREEDCLLYEKSNNPSFIMYDNSGEVTNDLDMAVLVEIKEPRGIPAFCAYVNNKSECQSVISPGIYYWNILQSEYLHIPDFILEVIKKVC